MSIIYHSTVVRGRLVVTLVEVVVMAVVRVVSDTNGMKSLRNSSSRYNN